MAVPPTLGRCIPDPGHQPAHLPSVPSPEEWQRLRAAYERVKEFPEFQPEERARWLELRACVEQLLERHG